MQQLLGPLLHHLTPAHASSPESLGDELAAASASGGFEPAELVTQDEREDSQASGP